MLEVEDLSSAVAPIGRIPGTWTAVPSAGRVPFAADLAAFGENVAIITADAELTYRDLAGRVEDTARRLGRWRRLVLLVGSNEIDVVVCYLAALSAGYPVLLVPDG